MDIAYFLERNPSWPLRRYLIRRAEEKFPKNLAPAAVLSWFEKYPPISGIANSGSATHFPTAHPEPTPARTLSRMRCRSSRTRAVEERAQVVVFFGWCEEEAILNLRKVASNLT